MLQYDSGFHYHPEEQGILKKNSPAGKISGITTSGK
jgi:hypothetical protein